MRLLVVRNDKLGDFMLAWPAFALLKQHWPEASVCALVPEYTRPMAELCPWIDEVVIDKGLNGKLNDIFNLRKQLRERHFDAMLTLFSTGRVALAGCFANIPYRLAPATKLAQLCYNHRLVQRRSRSEKPEYAYNQDLVYRLLYDLNKIQDVPPSSVINNDYLAPGIHRPLLQFDEKETTSLREKLYAQHGIAADTLLVFIHPGSGGSANNLAPSQYAELANNLRSEQPIAIIITVGPGEEEAGQQLAFAITAHPATTLLPKGGLVELARYLELCDIFISGSTGPLHIAGALDINTVSFYPRHRSGSPLRWQPLNSPEKRLIFVPEKQADEKNVASIDIHAATRKINKWLLTR